MFRFTDKEDRVGVGVYDVILKYNPGRYMLTMGRKPTVAKEVGG